MMTATVRDRRFGDHAPDPMSTRVTPRGLAIITYDLVGERVNALRPGFVEAFARVVDEVESNPDIRAAMLVSGKPDGFISGMDLEMLRALSDAFAGAELCEKAHEVIDQIAQSTKPIVAAIHGPALGAGFEIALACRARVASDSPETAFGFPEVRLGLLPALNGLQRLAGLAGLQVALRYGLGGESMGSSTARELGVVQEVVPPSILQQVAGELALDLARRKTKLGAKRLRMDRRGLVSLALEKSRLGRLLLFKKAREQLARAPDGHDPAPMHIIEVLESYARAGFEASRRVEARAFGELVTGEVAVRLMDIARFATAVQKETGTDDPEVQPLAVDKVGIVGAGLRGASLAALSIERGVVVRLKDLEPSALARGLGEVARLLDDRVRRRGLSPAVRNRRMGLLTTTTDYSGMKTAQLVFEAVPEQLALKRQVLDELEAQVGPEMIVASTTASLPIGDIAQASGRPENVVGMHYLSPVDDVPLLEVIRSERTAPEVVATAVALGRRQGKTVIVVRDSVGFYTSRVLAPYLNEAAWLLAEGAAIETIDQALVGWGWPVGPFTLLDSIGIDTADQVAAILVDAFGNRLAPPTTMARLLDDGRRGRKNQRGLYAYGEAAARELRNRRERPETDDRGAGLLRRFSRRPRDASSRAAAREPASEAQAQRQPAGPRPVDRSVYAVLGLAVPEPKSKPAVPLEEIQSRCTLQLVNEAMHCWGDGVLRSARDGDLGAVLGLGFPPFRGGPFRYVDTVGAAKVARRIESYYDRFGARWTPAPALREMARVGKRFYEEP